MDIKAFKYDELANMQGAIDTYVEDVNQVMTDIQNLKTFGSNAAGFYGETQAATINTYIDNTCDAIKGIVTRFETFKTALDTVKNNYDAMQKSVKTGDVKEPNEVSDDTIITVNAFSGSETGGTSGAGGGASYNSVK